MNHRVVIDKGVYVLVGMLFLASMVLQGCVSSTDTSVDPADDIAIEEVITEEVVETGADSATGSPLETDAAVEVETTVETDATSPVIEESDSVYEDGTYTETGSYVSPAGPESVTVTVTVTDDVVTGVSVVSNAVNPNSIIYQSLFIDGVNSVVVGKSLDELGSLGPVNGSSLTPTGFNQAMVAIQAEAKA